MNTYRLYVQVHYLIFQTDFNILEIIHCIPLPHLSYTPFHSLSPLLKSLCLTWPWTVTLTWPEEVTASDDWLPQDTFLMYRPVSASITLGFSCLLVSPCPSLPVAVRKNIIANIIHVPCNIKVQINSIDTIYNDKLPMISHL